MRKAFAVIGELLAYRPPKRLVFVLPFLVLMMSFQNCGRRFEEPQIGSNTVAPVPVKPPVLEVPINPVKTVPAQIWATEGCNTTSYFQDPDSPDIFWGRRLRYSGLSGEDAANECTFRSFGLARYQADFKGRTLRFVEFIHEPHFQIQGGRTVTTAYDPSVAFINGTKYVAFECHGSGFPEAVGICLGPLIQNRLDTAQTRVLVEGVTNETESFSSSVPKLTSFGDQTYLAWTQVRLDRKSGKFQSLKSRGLLIQANTPRLSTDSPYAYDIYNPLTQNGAADTFDAKYINGTFYYTGARGENGCVLPLDPIDKCYRLTWGATTHLNAPGALDGADTTRPELFDNPQEYFRWVKDPEQGWGVMGQVLPMSDKRQRTQKTLTPGLYFFPVEKTDSLKLLPVKAVAAAASLTPVAAPNTDPVSTYATVIESRFTELRQYQSGCNINVPTGPLCKAAVHRLCLQRGFAGGVGLTELNGDTAQLVCLPSSQQQMLHVSFTTLTGLQNECAQGRLTTSAACRAAVNRYCISTGFEAGTGIAEFVGNDSVVGCVLRQTSNVKTPTFTELNSYHPGCTRAQATGIFCDVAAHRYCVTLGYRASTGIVESKGDETIVNCLK